MNVDPSIPLGHIIPAHRTFGWCSLCPDRTPLEELAAWQTRELRRVVDEARQAGDGEAEPKRTPMDPVHILGVDSEDPDEAAALRARLLSRPGTDLRDRFAGVLAYAEQVAATSGPGPASAVQAVIDRLRAAMADEAQQATKAGPDTTAWHIDIPVRGEWQTIASGYTSQDGAHDSYQQAVDINTTRPVRLVRATTTYAVEAEHTPDGV